MGRYCTKLHFPSLFANCVCKDRLLVVSLFKPGVREPDSYVAATPSPWKKCKSMKGTAVSKRLHKCDEKIIDSKVTFLKGSGPPPLPTSERDPAPAKELCIPSPVLESTSWSESHCDDFQDALRVDMTI
jgi:hypothetical protein